jgi:phage tail protein X
MKYNAGSTRQGDVVNSICYHVTSYGIVNNIFSTMNKKQNTKKLNCML